MESECLKYKYAVTIVKKKKLNNKICGMAGRFRRVKVIIFLMMYFYATQLKAFHKRFRYVPNCFEIE